MLLIRALPLFGILGFSYGSTRGLLKMPTFPEKCIYSGTDCWSLMLKPDLEGCPQNVNGIQRPLIKDIAPNHLQIYRHRAYFSRDRGN